MNKLRIVSVVLPGLLLAGCASDKHLFFGTQTSVGVDVSGTVAAPDHVSVAYRRSETAIVPRKEDGKAHSVMGKLDADLTVTAGRKVRQVFATGEAARIASMRDAAAANGQVAAATGVQQVEKTALVFATDSVFGLDISSGTSELSPSLVFGYRRSEATLIPIPDPAQEVRSVYADISVDNSDKDTVVDAASVDSSISNLGGVRIVQHFGTGRAAELLAGSSEVRTKLFKAATGSPINTSKVKGDRELQAQIKERVGKLNAEQQASLLGWADVEFDTRLKGARDKRDNESAVDYLENIVLQRLDTPELSKLLVKATDMGSAS